MKVCKNDVCPKHLLCLFFNNFIELKKNKICKTEDVQKADNMECFELKEYQGN